MARDFIPKIATGNDLLEGDVVYFTESGDWTRDHGDAAVAGTEEQAQALLSRASGFPQQVVGVYLAEARIVNGRPAPVHFREVFRTRGPSNYPHHGRQARA
ncbi:DUF2849 domain-containing protein [Halovulum dunhuangense]|uniref:DUF2849 domain-containing protein n=1 Tax=Halovulum dunhuangense TaxID=1505036 RepID=A0A849KXE0_9RHOB|nr:DUF2849 domain-containing protein [Halovulum dunhuangense]NNU79197.1 DUF2849 domain-containing protein [Halovulum dunhuangense]